MDSLFDVFYLRRDISVLARAISDNNKTKRLKLGLKSRIGLAALDSAIQYLTILRKIISSLPGLRFFVFHSQNDITVLAGAILDNNDPNRLKLG